MKDLPKEQRPYEKCMAYGPKALTDSELLAVIIRTGSSERTSLELADAILSQNAPGDGLTGLLHCSLGTAAVHPWSRSCKRNPAFVHRRAF